MDVKYPAEADLDRLLAVGPRMVSTALGPMEYAEAGEGPVLMSVHGSYGGWDYGLGMAAVYALNGFRVIAPSRPGFLGTPLSSGRTYEEQADALAALLAALGIERAAVLAFSGGGPPTFLLAARHPERVGCLVEVSALSTAFPPLKGVNRLLWAIGESRVGLGAFMALLRTLVVRRPTWGLAISMGEETAKSRAEIVALARRIVDDPYRWAFVKKVYAGVSAHRVGARFPGQKNDNALMLGVRSLPLADVGCPTLLVGGTADRLREHVEFAGTAIPEAELRWVPGGGHRGFWLNDDFAEHQAYTLAWLHEHSRHARHSLAPGQRTSDVRATGHERSDRETT
ncbi:MAG TPA: alpha/beta hydrolase [Jiangellaceae bacterium]